jgi:hypothetical protein
MTKSYISQPWVCVRPEFNPGTVYQAYYIERVVDASEHASNAKVIHAAPELLGATAIAADVLGTLLDDDNVVDRFLRKQIADALERCCVAIALANGKAQ